MRLVPRALVPRSHSDHVQLLLIELTSLIQSECEHKERSTL